MNPNDKPIDELLAELVETENLLRIIRGGRPEPDSAAASAASTPSGEEEGAEDERKAPE